jgi:hypothetical protein
MQQEDTKPWYRQFWPWFLIMLPASAVAAGIYTLILAIKTQDSLVVDSSDFSIGRAKDAILLAENRARELGLGASIDIDLESGLIVARLFAEQQPAAADTLTLDLSHPAFAERDHAVTLTRALPAEDGTPTWAGHFTRVPEGRWYVVIESGDQWRLNGVWNGETQIVLRAASDDGG